MNNGVFKSVLKTFVDLSVHKYRHIKFIADDNVDPHGLLYGSG